MKLGYGRYIIITFIAIPLAMMTVFIFVLELANKDWKSVDAIVQSTNIKSIRPGTLAWGLIVNFTYEVDGRQYNHTGLNVFHDTDWNVTNKEQQNWPEGRTFTLYYNPQNPASISLASDGGAQRMAVLAAIFSPMIMVIIGFVILLVRRWCRS